MILPFNKCHANGNDFILIYSEDFPKNMRNKNIIKHLCCRHTGIGADGLFIIFPSTNHDFVLEYYNADGSGETLCANGSRCAVYLMYKNKGIVNNMNFLAGDGEHRAKILEDGVIAMQMKTPKYKSALLSIDEYCGYFIDSGARHFVISSNLLENSYIYEIGKKIRFANVFQPHGINVNFYNQIDKHTVKIKTYEKGVENVMLSCASGSAAVVFHLAMNKSVESPVLVQSTGGELLVHYNESWSDAWVNGPAELVFSGNYYINKLLHEAKCCSN